MRIASVVLFSLFLAALPAPAWATQEQLLDVSEVKWVSPGARDTGEISFAATISADGRHEWADVEITAFGKQCVLDAGQLAALKGFPARTLVITFDEGNEKTGGHTVHFRVKRLFQVAEKMTEQTLRLSVSKGKGLAVGAEPGIPTAP